jgi:cellulose synthase operon protein YhjQ
MDSQGTDKIEDLEAAETPEDVAVLYSWANLHGAKYRDFSASRREYRAQLRLRAADGQEQAPPASSEPGVTVDAAAGATSEKLFAAMARGASKNEPPDGVVRSAAEERVEAARRAEAAAVAEATARREEREIAEAHAAAQRQADRYADSEIRHRTTDGQILPPSLPPIAYAAQPRAERSTHQPMPSLEEVRPNRTRKTDDFIPAAVQTEPRSAAPPATPRRPQGYHPDDASGVRQIYRGSDLETLRDEGLAERDRRSVLPQPPSSATSAPRQESKPMTESMYSYRPSSMSYKVPPANLGQRRTDPQVQQERRAPRPEQVEPWPMSDNAQSELTSDPGFAARREDLEQKSAVFTEQLHSSVRPGMLSQGPTPPDSTRGRRAHDDFDYKQVPVSAEPVRRSAPEPTIESPRVASPRPPYAADPAGPAWLYAPPTPPPAPPKPIAEKIPPTQSSVADTLQHSRERVASRWFALKGVFDQPGQEQSDSAPVRQKETRTPILAVFSLAGGVGKTSLVATVGRALSSLGEKVLLTDTTSHGLLPFYFGASELRQGTVRTFSPPSGSTDAPIYLVSYDIEQKGSDEAAQEQLIEEIINNSRGTHRILLDLTTSSSWIVRRMARMSPTILVPVAPDMNSVISLQAVERYFHGVTDGDGRPIQPFYVLNQFDTSLPLHLDVREVLRRQLGDRLLPFVIRRAPSVSEALAEGMTVVDYVPDAPIAEDYVNLATWLRTIAAPATAGFRNVRWSER